MQPDRRITNQSALNQLRQHLSKSDSQDYLLANPSNANPQVFMDSLTEQERQEFARKLFASPSQQGGGGNGLTSQKLKHMIDDLYQKEKKYVKQYLREDFIENNNVIFELQKVHQLDTCKAIRG